MKLDAALALHDAPRMEQFRVRFPKTACSESQDQEWCELFIGGTWGRLRFHDYDRIYRVPGLYEHLFYERLQCSSPRRVVSLLEEVLRDLDESPAELKVVDLGAGNGMVGEELRLIGAESVVGVDIIPEAAKAARRDRPDVYDDYVVADLCEPSEDVEKRLAGRRPNCLATVAALGFGDIPPRAFANVFNVISTPGWVAFNIKETFLNHKDDSGFARFVRALSDQGIVQVQAYRRYNHRLSVAGEKLYYVAMVARKLRDIPESLIGQSE